MSSDGSTPTKPASFLTLPKLIALLALTIVATGAVVFFALRSKNTSNEAVVSVLDERSAPAAKVNTGEVLDATVPNQLTPELGRRYRVRVDSESRDRASMIARIGRTVTFIKGVNPGDIVVVEVTRLNRSTAEAVVHELISSGPPPAPRPERAAADMPSRAAGSEPAGGTYTGTVVHVGKFGDGLIKRGQQQIYVPGVEKGDRVVYEVTDTSGRAWKAQLIRKLEKSESSSAERAEKADKPERPLRAPQIQPGQEYDVAIVEKERSNPDVDGVARIDGLAVLIPGCQPGDRVKIRITERLPSLAKAEVVERLPAAP
ncbi:MAG: TRAM domain-containing protein [Kiritimatiellae bacterium]|nr:TRAM domain-containing protein [Kiritimatiellia bacterium]